MARDYAKISTKKSPPKTSATALWITIAGVIVTGLVIGFIYKKETFHHLFHAQIKPQTKANKELAQVAASEKGSDINFAFYSELPKKQPLHPTKTIPQQNIVAQQPTLVAVTPATGQSSKPLFNEADVAQSLSSETQNGKYTLQLGAFDNASSAEKSQIQLSHLGCQARVVPVRVQKKMIYRLQTGSFVNQAQATNKQKELRDKGIPSLVRNLG